MFIPTALTAFDSGCRMPSTHTAGVRDHEANLILRIWKKNSDFQDVNYCLLLQLIYNLYAGFISF